MANQQEMPADKLFRNGPALVSWLLRTWATSLEVFLHRDMGERYLGMPAVLVLVLVPVYGTFWGGYDLRPMMAFLPAYLVMVVITRIGILRRKLRSELVHSYYTGWPRFMGEKAKFSEVTMKKFIEPVITFFFGMCVRDRFNAPLGTYLMIGAVCLFVSVAMSDLHTETRAIDMHDAVIDQEIVAERFREMRGDDY